MQETVYILPNEGSEVGIHGERYEKTVLGC